MAEFFICAGILLTVLFLVALGVRDRAGFEERFPPISDAEFLVAGVALYAGEGSKGDGAVQFANTDPAMIRFFCAWLRHFFEVDESRLRARVYLHEGLDLERAETFWSSLTGLPRRQFRRAHRAVAATDPVSALTCS